MAGIDELVPGYSEFNARVMRSRLGREGKCCTDATGVCMFVRRVKSRALALLLVHE